VEIEKLHLEVQLFTVRTMVTSYELRRRRRTAYPSELMPVKAIQIELGSGAGVTVKVPASSGN
jgi:hypothetical protein